jgi:hypothetical protein
VREQQNRFFGVNFGILLHLNPLHHKIGSH